MKKYLFILLLGFSLSGISQNGTGFGFKMPVLTLQSYTGTLVPPSGFGYIRNISGSLYWYHGTATYLLNPLTTKGDISYYNAGVQRLGIGSAGQVLSVSATGIPEWVSVAGASAWYGVYLPNDTYFIGYSPIGTALNIAKITTENILSFGLTVGLSSLYQPADAGILTLSNIPSVSALYGTELSQSLSIDHTKILKVGSYADGAGGTYGDFVKITGETILTPLNTGTVVAGTGITKAMIMSGDIRFNTSSAIDITADPQIVAGTDGQTIKIIGLSDTNTLTLDDGTGLQLAGGASFVMGAGDVISLTYVSSLAVWVENYRSNN